MKNRSFIYCSLAFTFFKSSIKFVDNFFAYLHDAKFTAFILPNSFSIVPDVKLFLSNSFSLFYYYAFCSNF